MGLYSRIFSFSKLKWKWCRISRIDPFVPQLLHKWKKKKIQYYFVRPKVSQYSTGIVFSFIFLVITNAIFTNQLKSNSSPHCIHILHCIRTQKPKKVLKELEHSCIRQQRPHHSVMIPKQLCQKSIPFLYNPKEAEEWAISLFKEFFKQHNKKSMWDIQFSILWIEHFITLITLSLELLYNWKERIYSVKEI